MGAFDLVPSPKIYIYISAPTFCSTHNSWSTMEFFKKLQNAKLVQKKIITNATLKFGYDSGYLIIIPLIFE